MNQTDHLHHWPAIAAHLGLTERQAKHLAKTAALPVYKLGTKTIAASKASIDAWRREREAASREVSHG